MTNERIQGHDGFTRVQLVINNVPGHFYLKLATITGEIERDSNIQCSFGT